MGACWVGCGGDGCRARADTCELTTSRSGPGGGSSAPCWMGSWPAMVANRLPLGRRCQACAAVAPCSPPRREVDPGLRAEVRGEQTVRERPGLARGTGLVLPSRSPRAVEVEAVRCRHTCCTQSSCVKMSVVARQYTPTPEVHNNLPQCSGRGPPAEVTREHKNIEQLHTNRSARRQGEFVCMSYVAPPSYVLLPPPLPRTLLQSSGHPSGASGASGPPPQ